MLLFIKVITVFRFYIDIFIDCLFGLYYISKRHRVSRPRNPLIIESATALATKIREKSVTSQEVVRAFISRIKEVNPIINALTDNRFDDAIKEAKEIDQDIASGKITVEDFQEKPFLGVPFTAKDTTACKGMKNTFGVLHRKDAIAQYDADAVILLKKAGAILLGVANVSQLDLWQETSNPVFGTTNNPYNSARTVGGSSGGGAAIIAACGSPIAIGTDIGGSLRIPAFMCGIFGHKPSNDLVSTKGIMHRTGKEGPTMVTIGTFTKNTEDIVPFLKVLVGNNVNRLKLDETVNVKELQVFYMLECGDPKISSIGSEMQEVISRTVNYFMMNSNSQPQKFDLPNMKYGGNLWRYWMTQEVKVKFERKPSELTMKAYRSKYTAGTLLNLINHLLPKEDEKWARKITDDIRGELVQKLGNNGVLLYPSAPWSARYHNTALFRPWNFYYFAVWNALKMPVTQVPLGLDSEGLPVGIQVVAAPYQDHLCIAVAKELEKAFGGYIAPSPLNKKTRTKSSYLHV